MQKPLLALTLGLLVGTALSPVASAQETTSGPGSPRTPVNAADFRYRSHSTARSTS
jgi:hypothetical protein